MPSTPGHKVKHKQNINTNVNTNINKNINTNMNTNINTNINTVYGSSVFPKLLKHKTKCWRTTKPYNATPQTIKKRNL